LFGGQSVKNRPNILFAIADDWSWPHASIAGDRVVKTPTFDRVASQGVLFTNAFVSAPSCTPSRGAILTGQYHWRLEDGANLFGTLPSKFPVYTDMLEQAGYHVGYQKKGWSPGEYKPGGWKRNPAGKRYKNFASFLQERQQGKPFCYWFGSSDPHRGYQWQSGVKSGMKLEDVAVPACLPDSEAVRTDICDYYWEVQRFDRQVGEILKIIEDAGELDNTLVVISSDNGMPFPRCKSNVYDMGTHVPFAASWPGKVKGGRVIEDFVSLCDLAPSFLEAVGLKPTADMTGRSLLDVLLSCKSHRVDPKRNKVLTGKERHVPCRPGHVSYPMRAIRTHDFLYIRNFEPDLWPAGDPEWQEGYWPKTPYGDIDASPTKTYMMEHRDDPQVKRLFELGFGKRPAEELYDLQKDPGQLNNVAENPKYAKVKRKLASALLAELFATKDPRVLGTGDAFNKYPFFR
jgi:arylsulfatase A-like enzyme